MASTATTTLRMELMATGENDTTWGTKINNNFEIMESAVSGTTAISTTGGTTTLTNVDYTNDQAKKAVLDVTGTLISNATIVIPNAPKVYRVLNRTSGAYTLSIKTSSGTAIVITQSTGAEVYCDGSNTMRFVTPLTDFTTGAPATSSGAAASAVSVTATGNLSSTNAQAALVELQTDINTINTALTTYQPLDADLTAIAAVTTASYGRGLLTYSSEATFKAGVNLEANTDFYAPGGTDVPVTDGGTGSSTAAGARTNLGLVIGTNVQAYDAELAAIAGLTSAADRLPYFTGSGTASLATFTTAGRALLDDASAAAQRTTLGLDIGSDVQAYDAELAAIAGLTSAADRLPYFTGIGTASLATFTAAGRALIDDADASAQRTTLGLVIGTNVQAYDAGLADVAALAVTNGNFIVGNGTNWVAESGATARTSLGVSATGADTTYNYRANNLSDVASAATSFTNIKQAASTTATGVVELATAAEMVAGTAGKVPTADIVKNSPGVAKFFLCATVSAGTPSITDSYNMTSITDTTTGSITGTIATDFAAANWAATLSLENDVSNLARFYYILNGGYTAGTFITQAHNVSDGSFRDPAKWFVTGHGEQ